ncbi:MAG: alginate export family protein [Sphingopyxis sp.]
MTKYIAYTAFALATALAVQGTAHAAPGDPIRVGDGITIDPQIDMRLRYESVNTPVLDADAMIARLRAGLDVGLGHGFSVLGEVEGTLSVKDHYNSTVNGHTGYATVADPESIELNRLAVRWSQHGTTVTAGRQRINIDDQRFVGSVGWRANEQTFDAVRVESNALGKVAIDLTYSNGQRTIFGSESTTRTSLEGDFVFANAVATFAPVTLRVFDYYLNYDAVEPNALRNSSNTVGAKASARFTLRPGTTIDLSGTYAHQVDVGPTTANYAADYIAASAALAHRGYTLTAAYEELGSDGGVEAFQTPMATLHKFNGWADLFLATPVNGLRDYQIALARAFPAGHSPIPGLTMGVAWHRFEGDHGGAHYGDEWDAQIGFRITRVGVTLKYADYNASAFGRDTSKLWVQLDYQY